MKTKYLKITTAMLAALSISACGGGGGPVAKAPVVEPTEPTVRPIYYDRMYTATKMAEAVYGKSPITWVDFPPGGKDAEGLGSELPVSGSANYVGFMTLPNPSVSHLVPTDYASGHIAGDLDMDVNFADFTVAGTADKFSNGLDEIWSGNLTISGDIRETVHMTGTLTSEEKINGLGIMLPGRPTVVTAKSDTVDWVGDPDQPSAPKYIAGSVLGTMHTTWLNSRGHPTSHHLSFKDELFVAEITD